MLRLTSSVFMALALLLGQAALLEHEYDFAAHKSGDACVTCLHATPLSHALAGAIPLALSLPLARTEFHAPVSQIAAIADLAYRARAPPITPSV
jgi:hypothetical protein